MPENTQACVNMDRPFWTIKKLHLGCRKPYWINTLHCHNPTTHLRCCESGGRGGSCCCGGCSFIQNVVLLCSPPQDIVYSDDAPKMRFMKAMHGIAGVAAPAIIAAFDLSRFKAACDLGGGCTLENNDNKQSPRPFLVCFRFLVTPPPLGAGRALTD